MRKAQYWPSPKNRLRACCLSTEYFSSLSKNYLTYPGGQYEPSSPVKLKNTYILIVHNVKDAFIEKQILEDSAF